MRNPIGNYLRQKEGHFDTAVSLMAEISICREATRRRTLLSPHSKRVPVATLIDLAQGLPRCDRRSHLSSCRQALDKKVRRHHPRSLVAVVTNIPDRPECAYARRGYEDVTCPIPVSSDAARTASDRSMPDQIRSAGRSNGGATAIVSSGAIPSYDNARLSQRIAASYVTEA